MNKRDIHLTKATKKSLRDIKGFILKNPGRHITIGDLAVQSGIYRSKLTAAFKQSFGKSIYHFILETRMKCAKKLLLEEDLPIKSIAGLCGYRTVQSFSRIFKSFYHIPPSMFQKKRKRSVSRPIG